MKIISYYPVDRITALPQPILEIILSLVPIKDAVRTSILSRSWRYNWTTISKLVFNEKQMFDRPMKRMTRMSKIFPAIHQVLSMYQGPITEFSLTMKGDNIYIEKIDEIITYLSTNNTVKKFTLDFDWPPRSFSLPSSFYSLHQLTDIYLCNCDIYPIPSFKGGFPCLKNLHVDTGSPSRKSLGHLLSVSPVLKRFNLTSNRGVYCYNPDDFISMFEISKNLSLVEHMSLCMTVFQNFYEGAPPELPISALIHLKYLHLHGMRCIVRSLRSLTLLIRSSPNLEKLKIQVCEARGSSRQLDYSDVCCLGHLRELEVVDCGEDKYHLEFVKFILAKSPVLKKVSIVFHNRVFVHSVEGIEAMRVLLQSPCASPVAEFNFEHPIYDLVGFKSLYTNI